MKDVKTNRGVRKKRKREVTRREEKRGEEGTKIIEKITVD